VGVSQRLGSAVVVAVLLVVGAVGSAAAQTFQLRTTGFADGDGTVTSSPAGISCTYVDVQAKTGTCAAPFTAGTVVTLTATPANGGSVGNVVRSGRQLYDWLDDLPGHR
jgi:hypothetical protein